MLPLKIPRQILDEMVAHARALDPYECCGLLAGNDGVVTRLYRVKNIIALDVAETVGFDDAKVAHLQRLSPEERAEIAFAMDSQDLSLAQKDMREKNIGLEVVYHSHTSSPARPSITDISIATQYEEYWDKINLKEPVYIIISLETKAQPDIRAYKIKGSQVSQIEFQAI